MRTTNVLTELGSAFDGHGVPVRDDWDNQDVSGDDAGQYFLFHPEHWQQVFGTAPSTGRGTTYEVEQRRDGQVVWQGTVRAWEWESTRPQIVFLRGMSMGGVRLTKTLLLGSGSVGVNVLSMCIVLFYSKAASLFTGNW